MYEGIEEEKNKADLVEEYFLKNSPAKLCLPAIYLRIVSVPSHSVMTVASGIVFLLACLLIPYEAQHWL